MLIGPDWGPCATKSTFGGCDGIARAANAAAEGKVVLLTDRNGRIQHLQSVAERRRSRLL